MPTRGPTVKFWLHPDFAQTPQVKGPVPQDFPLLQMPVPSPRLWLVLLTNWPESWSLHTRFLGFSNLLEWLTELREVLYSLLPVYYKAFDSGIAKGKKYIGQGILEMVWSFHNPSGTSMCSSSGSSPNLIIFHSNTWTTETILYSHQQWGGSYLSTSSLVICSFW